MTHPFWYVCVRILAEDGITEKRERERGGEREGEGRERGREREGGRERERMTIITEFHRCLEIS